MNDQRGADGLGMGEKMAMLIPSAWDVHLCCGMCRLGE